LSQDTIVQLFLCDILDNTIYNKPPQSSAFDKDTEATTPFKYKKNGHGAGEYRARNEIYTIKSDDLHKQF